MATRRAWVLNLDADVELATRGAYHPSRSVAAATRRHAPAIAATLLGSRDVLLSADDAPDGEARGLVGRAFCPTPSAIARLLRAGAEPEPHPHVDVLRRVNARRFSAAISQELPGACFVTSFGEAEVVVASRPPIGEAWRVKRDFGMSGRGQRVVPSGRLSPDDEAFVRGAIDKGGAQIEPQVAIVRELALHAVLDASGSLVVGAPCVQRCDARGAWLGTERLADPPVALAARLGEEVERVGHALHVAGYFGPFGVDAFEYEEAGAVVLCRRSEINARYSMGFGVGFGHELP